MTNYSYKVGGDKFILSPEEHEKIKEGVKKGQSQFWLREGTMMVNMSITWNIHPTIEPTEAQQQEIENQLRLPSPRWKEPTEEEKIKFNKLMSEVKIKKFS